jgi:DNA replication protein DnaC
MTTKNQELNMALKRLRLSGMEATFETRALQAAQGGMDFIEAFSLLVQDETDRRQSKFVDRAFSTSGLKEKLTFDNFNWSYNPKTPKKLILELCSLKFIYDNEDALLIGSPGTGKSHSAKVIAHKAILAGLRVLYREAHILFEDIAQQTAFGHRKKIFKTLSDVDLLVIDDLALKKLPANAAEELLDIILKRYQKKSTLITSNRVLEDWGKMLEDQTAASAILDRLLHHAHLANFEGKSWRLKEAAERASTQKKLDSKTQNP